MRLGKTSDEKSRLLSGIARISETPHSTPQLGQLGPFFPDVKTTFCAYDRKRVPMVIMMIEMITMIVMMVILMIMLKNYPKKYKYYAFLAKMYQF